MSLYCEHNRIGESCEDCKWAAADADGTLRVADPAPEVTAAANRERAAAATRAVERAAEVDDDVSLAFALDPPKRGR
jgi:hypothetical protein